MVDADKFVDSHIGAWKDLSVAKTLVQDQIEGHSLRPDLSLHLIFQEILDTAPLSELRIQQANNNSDFIVMADVIVDQLG